MNEYFLLDVTHNKRQDRRLKICAAFSHLALFHNHTTCSERLLSQYWTYSESLPSQHWRSLRINTSNLKWYINNFVKIEDPVWNADFLRGITQYGLVQEHRCSFSTFFWNYNPSIEELFETCPFYGVKNINFQKRDIKHYYGWQSSAALSLPYSKNSISFMAGVLATGQIVDNYVRYNFRITPWLKQWQIPIDRIDGRGRAYISPFWPALLTPWMPPVGDKWLNIKKAHKAEEYALIMWKIFTDKDIKTKGLPYLISRRSYYYRYGSIKKLARQWVEEKMVGMDLRFKDIVQFWEKKTV